MNTWIATAFFSAGITGLFVLNRDRSVRTSNALWIAVVWLLIAGSRTPSAWFQAQAPISADDLYLQGNAYERNLFSGLLLLAVVALYPRWEKIAKLVRANAPIFLFILYCALSLVWSDYPEVGLKRWIKLVGDLCMVLIVVTDGNPAAAFDRLITRTGFLIVPLSILFIRYFPDLGRGYDGWNGTAYWTGVTTNKNALGLICMIVGLHALWRLIRAFQGRNGGSRARALTVHGAMLVMVAYLLHAANSATSTSCFLLGGTLIVAISFFRWARRPLMVHSLALGAVLVAACAAFFNFAGLVEHLGRKADLTGRSELWSIVLSQPVNRLLGAGYESFWVGARVATIQKLSGQFANQAHDGYIEILVNLGWIGVALLALIIVTGYRKIGREVLQNPKINCLKLAFLVSALTYNFTEAAYKMTCPVWICLVWAIVSAPTAARQKKPRVLEAPQAYGAEATVLYPHVREGLPHDRMGDGLHGVSPAPDSPRGTLSIPIFPALGAIKQVQP